jgi:hypothetical protein
MSPATSRRSSATRGSVFTAEVPDPDCSRNHPCLRLKIHAAMLLPSAPAFWPGSVWTTETGQRRPISAVSEGGREGSDHAVRAIGGLLRSRKMGPGAAGLGACPVSDLCGARYRPVGCSGTSPHPARPSQRDRRGRLVTDTDAATATATATGTDAAIAVGIGIGSGIGSDRSYRHTATTTKRKWDCSPHPTVMESPGGCRRPGRRGWISGWSRTGDRSSTGSD